MESSDVSQIKRVMSSYNCQFFRHKAKLVYCRQCGVQVAVGHFADHLRDDHALNCATACPFCYAQFQWQRGELSTNLSVAEHRKQCLKTFLKTHRKAPRIVLPSDHQHDTTPVYEGGETLMASPSRPEIHTYAEQIPDANEFCPTCYDHHKNGVLQHMDGRTRHEEWGTSFYSPFPEDPLFFQDHGPNHVRFSEESGLGLCAYNIFQCYLSGEYAFYHLMVRAHVWWDFMTRDWPGVHFLPYSTLCDGFHKEDGEDPEDEERDEGRVHHRHLIVAMKRDDVAFFKQQWQQVAYRRRPPRTVDKGGPVRRQRNKLCVSVDDANHLMYVLAYNSKPKGICDGYGNKDETTSGSHYWIFRELSPCAKLSLAALWEQGHATLVSKRHRESSLVNYFYHVEEVNNKWQVQLAYLAMKEKKCVLPFAKGFELCDEWAANRPTVYLYGRAKYLRYVPELCKLRYDAWLRHQIQTGNNFWACVGHEYYTLEHYQTRCMNVTKQVLEEVKISFDREEVRMLSVIGQLKREVNNHSAATENVLRELGTAQGDVRTTQSYLQATQNDLRMTQSCLQTTQNDLKMTQSCLQTTQKELTEAQTRIGQYQEQEKKWHLRIRQLEVELKRVREQCVVQLKERLKVSEERLRVAEESNLEYRRTIQRLEAELKNASDASYLNRIRQLEKALQVMTQMYQDVSGQGTK
ncbi:hypothetical protein JTE90_020624 [Oedothorax gibbosus]|uniref:Uncharacterized protein n=1 Tax=Oedothorax gibbosus TaxID=931172 RepID=A0AAV6TTU9_9ARAC|nr:hypothetical protein JTE90_020624 [Oedothorax gibbosus]